MSLTTLLEKLAETTSQHEENQLLNTQDTEVKGIFEENNANKLKKLLSDRDYFADDEDVIYCHY